MASPGSNVTAVHFSLIFFVMLSIILGVVSYLKIDETGKLRSDNFVKDNEARKNKKERDNALELSRNFRTLSGHPQTLETVGNKDSAIEKLREDLKQYGDDSITLRGALMQTILDLDKAKAALTKAKRDFDQNKKDLRDENDRLNKKITSKETDAQGIAIGLENRLKQVADKVLVMEKKFEKDIAERQLVIDNLQADKRKLTADMDTLRATHQEQIAKLDKAIKDLQNTVALKQQQIDALKKFSFERADGVIFQVDHSTKLVWINLGKEDRLPDRTTFSVYSRTHHGIARGKDDIKGSIEITRIVGPHMAEARILKSDIFNPIRAGDPIYTPLWSPGVTESFAFAGVIDLDGDGRGDRDLLHRLVKAAGAKISNEIDDQGVRHGTGITHNDKFLVVGTIPDPQETADPKEREIRIKMSKALYAIEQEAKNKGVRKVRLADFLLYIGFKADRRLWRPGDLSKRTLKAGARSTAVNQIIGRRQSSGQISGIYTKRGRIRQPVSSGQVSKRFGGRGR